MVAGKQTKASAQALLENGYADMVAFGQPFITNPDFVTRLQYDLPLTEIGYDAHATFYGGGESSRSHDEMREAPRRLVTRRKVFSLLLPTSQSYL